MAYSGLGAVTLRQDEDHNTVEVRQLWGGGAGQQRVGGRRVEAETRGVKGVGLRAPGGGPQRCRVGGRVEWA